MAVGPPLPGPRREPEPGAGLRLRHPEARLRESPLAGRLWLRGGGHRGRARAPRPRPLPHGDPRQRCGAGGGLSPGGRGPGPPRPAGGLPPPLRQDAHAPSRWALGLGLRGPAAPGALCASHGRGPLDGAGARDARATQRDGPCRCGAPGRSSSAGRRSPGALAGPRHPHQLQRLAGQPRHRAHPARQPDRRRPLPHQEAPAAGQPSRCPRGALQRQRPAAGLQRACGGR